MPTLIERRAVWPGKTPTNTSGSPRPLLAKNRPYLTVHYTGTPSNYGDHGDTIQECRNIQTSAQNSGKPWEYNYVVDTQGQVVEYAGHYQAAHSAGENLEAYGVLLLLGVGEAPTSAMIEAFRWLRWVLTSFGNLSASHQVRQHRDMPGAATICPGQPTIDRWAQFLVPWSEPAPTPPPPPPTPVPPTGVGCLMVVQDGDGWWSIARRAYATVDVTKVGALMTANGNKALRTGDTVTVPGKHA